ncbi:methyl-accepting chemotaxis protein [Pseudomonas saliphila]|uniref:methyl-accepting chemotaxis protein n=1 Tax=Pseudomonas saliphila TaxID=2586906 RepID=UPI001238853C|nr:methyl-accepting chemotaxis protein [Pseudomonas saliphila]
MNLLRRFTISQRLLAVTSLTLVIICVLVAGFAVDFRQSLLDGRALKTQHIVESGMGVLEYFHDRQMSGELTEAQAKAQAMATLEKQRYGENDYFWVHTLDLKMLMHPFSKALEGNSIAQVKDPDGKFLFREMNDVVRADAAGFVDYAWPKPGVTDPAPKISYVSLFEPWGLVLGSGIYLDDVNGFFWAQMTPKLTLVALGLVLLIGFNLLITRSVNGPLGQAVRAMNNIATGEGDLTQRLDATGNDEVAGLARGFNAFTDKLSGVIDELRDVVSRNRQIATDVGTAMGKAEASYNQQSSELDTIASAVEQMSATVEEISRRMSDSSEAAKEAGAQSARGHQTADNTSAMMTTLATDITRASQAVSELNENSKTIGSVLEVIRGVADQTNLLALNAAIEAARAGEQGRGFAVVADEVRTLASRTQRSTDEIQGMISLLQSGTTKAVNSMEGSHRQSEEMQVQVEASRTALASIATSVSTITDMTHQVAAATEEQSQTSNEIARSLHQLSALGGKVMFELKDTAENTEHLKVAAEQLERLIGQFKTARR